MLQNVGGWALGSWWESGAGQINTFLAERAIDFDHSTLASFCQIGRPVVQASLVWSHSGEVAADASKHAGNA